MTLSVAASSRFLYEGPSSVEPPPASELRERPLGFSQQVELFPGPVSSLSGEVVSGRGWAAGELSALDKETRFIVKEPLFPGSLNILLKKPIRLVDAAGSGFDSDRKMLWPASLNGLDVWVYRWREAPLHVAEILSGVHLRHHLHLNDGDEISLYIREQAIEPVNALERIIWAVFWEARRHWFYSDRYYNRTRVLCAEVGAAQCQPVVNGTARICFYIANKFLGWACRWACRMAIRAPVRAASAAKRVIKGIPIVGPLAQRLKSKVAPTKFTFSRADTDNCVNEQERLSRQILNILNFTKISNSDYSAQHFPAGYHTVNLNSQKILGQRDPSKRLSLAPIDFSGKTVLDLGCNQGGMIHELSNIVRWAVGVDYDPHMINAANRIRNATKASSTSFYIVDLDNEPLSIIKDFLPDKRVDVCFLLSVCMWIVNWKTLIDFAHDISESMLFETNGTVSQQQRQMDYLTTKYTDIQILSETSEDDPNQKSRKLFFLSSPI